MPRGKRISWKRSTTRSCFAHSGERPTGNWWAPYRASRLSSGAALVRWRLDWVAGAAEQFAAELECLGEQGEARLRYRGRLELADTAGWEAVLAESLPDDRARAMTTAGPHRDELVLEVNGRGLRDCGPVTPSRPCCSTMSLPSWMATVSAGLRPVCWSPATDRSSSPVRVVMSCRPTWTCRCGWLRMAE
jgi:hypothetical protein